MDMRQLNYWSRVVFNQPHLIAPDVAEVIAGVLIRARTQKGAALKAAPEVTVRYGDEDRPTDFQMLPNGIGVIPVMGELVHRHDWMSAMSGLTSYNKISDQLVAAMRDDSVQEILLHIDSPGGMVKGCFDLVEQIREARETKPITAFADGNMTSAAYAIGSAANRVIASETANVGSIGVLMMHVDRSAFLKEQGLKVTYIKSGADKTLGNPNEALSDEDREKLQAHVDSVAQIFFAHVSQSRSGLSVEDVRSLEAGVFLGAEALDLGLIDEVRSYQDALAALTEQPYGSWQTGRGARMQAEQDEDSNKPKKQKKPEGEEDMTDEDRNKLALLVGLHASASVEEIIKRIQSGQKEHEAAVSNLNQIYEALGLDAAEETFMATTMDRINGLKNLAVSQEDHDALATELRDLKATVLIDKAIKEDRKLMPAERDAWLADAKEDYEGTAAKLEARPQVIPSGGLPDGPDKTADATGDQTMMSIRERTDAYMAAERAKGNIVSRFEATVAVTRGAARPAQ